MTRGAIVLCGGKSSRMGADKATLPFGSELMLPRIVRLVSQVIDSSHIVVVAAAGQVLPALPSTVIVTRDEQPGRGPLEGIAAGLRSLPTHIQTAYATSCDVPLLLPPFIQQMFEQLGQSKIAVPFDGRFHHPLAAVYRTDLLPIIQAQLKAGKLQARVLFDLVDAKNVDLELLKSVDPKLQSLMNLNRPEDYQAAIEVISQANGE